MSALLWFIAGMVTGSVVMTFAIAVVQLHRNDIDLADLGNPRIGELPPFAPTKEMTT